ncbi:PREDICTED: pathogenesis-related protein PR-1-like [Tarenaya hassleriana]|uniref:pathogenesis-related protein PR-1-like n=1 Tax=Tarenaya hassleriana TaxID=28532 RepID=UPI00053C5345|nr:PREDICTED: pathogenesis-related protein PR-1-like [Tarenaya hassleriana]
MATGSSTQTLAVALLLLAVQVVQADYYRPRPPPSPSHKRYVPKIPLPSPNPNPIPVYPTPTPTPQPPAGSLAQQFLEPQNAVRAQLGLQPMVWDGQLEGYATWWANQRRYDCALTHSTGPYGENLFWGSGSDWTPAQAVQTWTVEGKFYNYYDNSCGGGEMCGHYTQIVWRDTKRLGCARVVCDNGLGVFITCNYDPPGNYIGEKPY